MRELQFVHTGKLESFYMQLFAYGATDGCYMLKSFDLAL